MRLLLKAFVVIGVGWLFSYLGSPPDADTILAIIVAVLLCGRLDWLLDAAKRLRAARALDAGCPSAKASREALVDDLNLDRFEQRKP